MGIETILMFAFIAIISSIFNKDKKPAKRRQTTKPQVSTMREPETRKPVEKKVPPKRDVYRYDDIKSIEESYYHLKEDNRSKKPVNNLTDYKHSNKPLRVMDVDTITLEDDDSFDRELITFTPQTIIQGIIMSEILGKPKSMRR